MIPTHSHASSNKPLNGSQSSRRSTKRALSNGSIEPVGEILPSNSLRSLVPHTNPSEHKQKQKKQQKQHVKLLEQQQHRQIAQQQQKFISGGLEDIMSWTELLGYDLPAEYSIAAPARTSTNNSKPNSSTTYKASFFVKRTGPRRGNSGTRLDPELENTDGKSAEEIKKLRFRQALSRKIKQKLAVKDETLTSLPPNNVHGNNISSTFEKKTASNPVDKSVVKTTNSFKEARPKIKTKPFYSKYAVNQEQPSQTGGLHSPPSFMTSPLSLISPPPAGKCSEGSIEPMTPLTPSPATPRGLKQSKRAPSLSRTSTTTCSDAQITRPMSQLSLTQLLSPSLFQQPLLQNTGNSLDCIDSMSNSFLGQSSEYLSSDDWFPSASSAANANNASASGEPSLDVTISPTMWADIAPDDTYNSLYAPYSSTSYATLADTLPLSSITPSSNLLPALASFKTTRPAAVGRGASQCFLGRDTTEAWSRSAMNLLFDDSKPTMVVSRGLSALLGDDIGPESSSLLFDL